MKLPPPHTGTITAFDRTINIKGDASISDAAFTIAKDKIEAVMEDLGLNFFGSPNFNTMLNRSGFAIIMVTGNAGPNANYNKSMTVGVDYVLNQVNDIHTIEQVIVDKVLEDEVFADSQPRSTTVTQTDGLDFDGRVTVSTSNEYYLNDWNAIVEKVIDALNRGYNKDVVDDLNSSNQTIFETNIFNANKNAQVIVSNSTALDSEVKKDKWRTLYLKLSALDTVDVQPAVWAMDDREAYP